MHKYYKFINTVGVVILILLGFAATAQATLKVVQTPTVKLYTGESGTATTMRITPYPKDLDGNKLTMSDFGDNPTVTVDPKISGSEEIEGFTGITDNGDGTATLTGLSRDLASKSPYTTVGTGKSHSAGATVVFGNNPQIYGRLGAMENGNTWTGQQTFSSTTASAPRFDVDPGASAYTGFPGTVLVDVAQLNRSLAAGTVNGTYIANGVYQSARPIDAASSTVTGSTGAQLALTSQISTSTCAVATSSVIVTMTNGKMYGPCLDQSYSFNFTGNITLSGTTSASKGFIAASTSAVPASVSGATTTIDWAVANTHEVYISTNQAFVFLNVAPGESIKVIIHQDGTGSRTITNWGNTSTTTVKWPSGGGAPILSTAAGSIDEVSFFTGTSTSVVYGAATYNFK